MDNLETKNTRTYIMPELKERGYVYFVEKSNESGKMYMCFYLERKGADRGVKVEIREEFYQKLIKDHDM
jgi:hypothetical protein